MLFVMGKKRGGKGKGKREGWLALGRSLHDQEEVTKQDGNGL